MYSTVVSRVVPADRDAVWRALTDPAALARWRVPDGMRAQVHELDPVPGGTIRMTLTHEDPTALGKTDGASDTYSGLFVEVVPGERLVEQVAFESDDPALRSVITVTTSLRAPAGGRAGTEVEIAMDGVPAAVPAAENEEGTRMALDRLARLVGWGP
jgi:uncharacterized protein YndB with AHSA1/START domain